MKVKTGIIARLEKTVKDAVLKAGVNKVVVGFSAGADSTALLLTLVASGVEVIPVHCNFHLRGEESMRDEDVARKICKSLNLDIMVIDFDVNGYIASRGSGTSVEMACRELRYAEFERIVEDCGADRIAVAHNADDNVETLLLNLFRGSGVTGLRGMLPDTGKIIRPLLNVSRTEIESYLGERNIGFVVDSTNLSNDYRRNYIRHDILPLIEKRWPGVRRAISTTIVNLRCEESVLKWGEEYWLNEGDTISISTISESPDPFWTIYKFASRYGVSRTVACEICDVFEKKAGSQLIVGKRWEAKGGYLIFDMKKLKFVCNEKKY